MNTMKALVLVGVLSVASLAWADGWVIWVEMAISEKEREPATTWGTLGAKETEQACRATLDERVAWWKKKAREGGDDIGVKGYTVTVRRASNLLGVSEMYRHSCLPAGSDPRDRDEK